MGRVHGRGQEPGVVLGQSSWSQRVCKEEQSRNRWVNGRMLMWRVFAVEEPCVVVEQSSRSQRVCTVDRSRILVGSR